MRTVIVELRSINALRPLKDLELANLIRVLDKDKVKDEKKLSASLKGTISKIRAHELNEELNKMRNVWEDRNI